MPVTVDAVKDIIEAALENKYPKEGKAACFLLFGGFGAPGLIDGATLAAGANAETANEITQDLAASLFLDSLHAGLLYFIETKLGSALKLAGIATIDAFEAATLLLSPTNLGLDLSMPVPDGPVTGPVSDFGDQQGDRPDHEGGEGHQGSGEQQAAQSGGGQKGPQGQEGGQEGNGREGGEEGDGHEGSEEGEGHEFAGEKLG